MTTPRGTGKPAAGKPKAKMVVAFLLLNPILRYYLVLGCYEEDRLRANHDWEVPHGLVKESDLT